jgi:SAM-dependent methyltransferase
LLEEVLSSGPSRRVLDLGCGTGEHARFLAAQGFEVVGVDRAPSMIATAREQAPAAGVVFVEGDLRDIDRLVEGRFGGALCLGNALPHLRCETDLDRFLSGLRSRLEPDAPLLMQLLNYQRIFDCEERYLPLNFRDDGEEEIIFLRLMDLRDNGEVVFYPSTLRLVPGAEPPLEVKAAKEVHLRGWRHLELIEALRRAGFARQDALGNFAGETFDPQVSHDLILVAR